MSLALDLSPALCLPLSSAGPASSVAASRGWTHRWKTVFGKSMSVLTVDGKEYLIGVQIAQLLKRETFNLYRSLKIKGIDVVRAENEQVDYLVNCNSIKRGTHSVTLVPLDDGLSFVSGALGSGGAGSDERRRPEGRGPRGKKSLKRSTDEMLADESSGDSTGKQSRVCLRKSLSLSGSDNEVVLSPELESSAVVPLPLSCASSAAALEESRSCWHMLLLIAQAEHAQL